MRNWRFLQSHTFQPGENQLQVQASFFDQCWTVKKDTKVLPPEMISEEAYLGNEMQRHIAVNFDDSQRIVRRHEILQKTTTAQYPSSKRGRTCLHLLQDVEDTAACSLDNHPVSIPPNLPAAKRAIRWEAAFFLLQWAEKYTG